MATRVGRVSLNRGTIRDLLNGGMGMDEVLREDAQKVLSRARGLAPVDTGEYRGSIRLEVDQTDRMVVRVVATDRKSNVIEHEHAVLAKALGASAGERGRTR